jgi:hypothetical protein
VHLLVTKNFDIYRNARYYNNKKDLNFIFGKSGRKVFWSLSSFTLPSFHDVEVLNETASLNIVPFGKHSSNLTPVTSAIIKLDVWEDPVSEANMHFGLCKRC